MDNTTIHPLSASLTHTIGLHLWRGAPENLDDNRPVQILINHGFVVGFSTERLQPAWSAYRVADYDRDVDYDREILYYDDMRLDDEARIGRNTFGRLGGVQLNVGHMSPNEVINRQFGRLAQLETFLMSNMSPQFGSLNQGVWLKLENAIRNIKDQRAKDHVWVIVGPVFGEQPASINRGNNKFLQVPEKYFCITVEPHAYPYDSMSKAYIDCFLIPQDAPRSSSPEDYPATLEEIEAATQLKFFKGWGRDLSFASMAFSQTSPESRLMKSLREQLEQQAPMEHKTQPQDVDAKSISDLVEALKTEVGLLKGQVETLEIEDLAHLQMVQHTISWLHRANEIDGTDEGREEPKFSNLITYKIVDDLGDKLKLSARTACNFWNRFVLPKHSIVIRLDTFTQSGGTIARAYKPFESDGVRYGKVEFNTKFLGQFSPDEITATIIHEIGHSLGIGWDDWRKFFFEDTGKFKKTIIRRLSALGDMEIEREGGPGTAFSHWDEDKFDKELMTGFKDNGEYVLPVTIDVMRLLGHEVIERLDEKTQLSTLLRDAEGMVFSRQNQMREIDLDYYEETELMETIPHEYSGD